MNFMKGYLTYALAAVIIAASVAGFVTKIVDLETALGMLWAGLAVFGIRRAVD